MEQVQGRYEESIEFYLEGLSLARGIGEKEAVAVFLANLSNIHEDQGEYGAALALLLEAETTARQINNVGLTAVCLAYLGSTRRQLGDHAGAEEALAEALGLARQIDNSPLVAEILTYQGELAIARGQWGQAATVLREAISEAEAAQQHRLGLLARLNAAKAERSAPSAGSPLPGAPPGRSGPRTSRRDGTGVGALCCRTYRAGRDAPEPEKPFSETPPRSARNYIFRHGRREAVSGCKSTPGAGAPPFALLMATFAPTVRCTPSSPSAVLTFS